MATQRLRVLEGHLTLSKCSVAVRPEQFIYTLEDGILTHNQRLFYEMNGFIVLADLVDPRVLDQCSQRFIDLCEGRVDKGNCTLMKDVSLKDKGVTGQYLYNKAQDLFYDEVFENYYMAPKLLDVVQSFTGPNIMGFHSMLINKPPDSGALTSRHPPHQDLVYFPIRPPNVIVAAWTALEDVTLDNGCLLVTPGSHTGHLLEHGYPDWEGGVNKAFHGIKDYTLEGMIPMPMKKGETIFFHPLLIHGSGPNRTKGFRKAISGHFASTECQFIEVSGSLHEPLAKEIEGIAKRRGFDLSFIDFWRLRQRVVRGVNINLI